MAVQPCQQFSLDGAAEQGFLAFYRSLPEKPETTFRVFDRSDYYTVHGPDALFAAKEVFKTTSVVKHLGSGDKKVPSVILSKMNFESTVRDLLLIRQYRVEMYRASSKGSKNTSAWELVAKASPGNLQQFEDILFGNNDMSVSTVVMSIKLGTDNGQRVCCALLVQLGPKECLLPQHDTSPDSTKVLEVIQRSNALVTDRKKAEFSNKDIVQDLNRLLKMGASGNSATLPEMDLTQATAALAALIKYLELLSDETNFGQFHLSTFDLSQFMKLDSAAVRALNLLPNPLDGGNKSMCLVGLLNKCKTAQGQRLLAQWVKQPLMDKSKIEERLDIVEVFFEDTELRQTIQEELRKVPDFSRLAKKFQRHKATLQDCVRVYQALHRLPTFNGVLAAYQGNHHELIRDCFTSPLQDLVQDFEKFTELVETTVDLDQVENHEYLIKASFDEGLQECREKMDEILEQIPIQLNKAARDMALEAGKSIKLESNNQYGYFFRITKKEEKALRGNKHYTTIDTRKDGIRFNNSALRQLNEQFQALKETYNEVQSKLANEVIKVAGGYSEPMQMLSDIIANISEMDLTQATAALAALIKYLEVTFENLLLFMLLSDETNFGQFHLSTFDLSQFMKLDSAAVRALNLLPNPLDGGNKSMCLVGLLNKCKTAQEERLDIVEVFFEDTELRQTIQEELRKVPDFSRLAKKFQRQKATLQDCVRVYQALHRLPTFNGVLAAYQGNHHELIRDCFTSPLQDLVQDFEKFTELVETTVDLDQVENHEYLIKASFDEGLQECREKMDEILEQIPIELNKAARDMALEAGKSIKLESNNQYGYFFRITKKEEKALRGNKHYTIIDTRKDGIRFNNSALRQLNEQFQALKETYNEVQSKLASEVIKVAGGYSEPMQMLSDIIANIDALIRVTKCTPQGVTGVIVLMAQLGCFVPCSSAEIAITDSILARVGSGDSQLKGVSTFMSEMLETASILRSATENSLIIIDELGRGTSTYDGFGLAWAISQNIATKIHCFCLFATHFHELTSLSDEVPTVTNLHVTAMTSSGTLTLLYKVKPGVCDQSFGIHVAELAHFPKRVIEFAKQKAAELEDFQGNTAALGEGIVDPDTGTSPAKRRRLIKQDGEEIIKDFLTQVAKLSVETMTEEQIAHEMSILKDKMLARKDPYIQELLGN
ncbi:PREDICTED: DNA mismatch repair protein Msh2-like [Acropora digitifera]|uniref:DNA mismatch repair protein Msh2-like n=1 Tax=Acropora digitifera TaxID=70779 RepID=UPI00077A44DA|nr:PREDICTED: DNA mismatch repair protein Msh2-like [Acropora digitifera]